MGGSKVNSYFPQTQATVRHVGCAGGCDQGRWPQLCDCKPLRLPVRPMRQAGYVLDDSGFPVTIQASTIALHDTGFGPIAHYGDTSQSDRLTWAIIALCLSPWITFAGFWLWRIFGPQS